MATDLREDAAARRQRQMRTAEISQHHGLMTGATCPFCDLTGQEIVAEIGPCVAIWTNESPPGSLMVLPVAHRQAPWDLTPEEWSPPRSCFKR